MTTAAAVVLDGESLTLATLARIAGGGVTVSLAPTAQARIQAGRAVVEDMVARKVPAYGITTGFGSQKDYALAEHELIEFNRRVIVGHSTFAPGDAVTPEAVRAALAIQLNLFATGRSGVRPELVEVLLLRLNAGLTPDVQSGSSVGASDIVSLSQMALPLLGLPGPGGESDGPTVAGGLAAKEAMSLMNSNTLTLAEAAVAVHDARRLLKALDRAAALSLEGFRGNPHAWGEAVERAHPQPGQIEAGSHLRALLSGSRLWTGGEQRFLQDPLSFRCTPQIHGAAYATLAWTQGILETELNASVDNPTVDIAAGVTVSHGNMENTLLAVALDALRLALAKALQACGERIHKLQWPSFSSLPTGLAATPGAIGGVQFLNLGHIAAAKVASATHHAAPASLLYHGQVCDGVEDVGGLAPQSVHATRRLLEDAWVLVTLESAIAAWAIDLRGIATDVLGEGLRGIQTGLRPQLPIGVEGITPFDLRPLVDYIRSF
ncbi:aromatic amino acid lyase [Lacibacterium aquatile]|uniref:Aromatic amino acid lyase n=1 Tax=Lacibacterium aquatile TaxID=1168082 RepID=A0ABW5DTV1_9PROT